MTAWQQASINDADPFPFTAPSHTRGMTTPGDTSMASLREVENLMKGARARV
jgi:hypothetical protein